MVPQYRRMVLQRGDRTVVKVATQIAPLRSKAGMDAPCAEEMAVVFSRVAAEFGGTFNAFEDDAGVTQYDWQFHLAGDISIGKMRAVMTGLGFAEFVNLNLRSHYPTLPFDLGGFHWKGNVQGNWYHIEFRPTRWPGNEVYPVDAHYDADRPSFVFHRTAKRRRICD